MYSFEINTPRATCFIDIGDYLRETLADTGLQDGALLVFVPHTTAGVTINENADPDVRIDLEMGLTHVVPGSLPFTHAEGNSDGHLKSSLVGCSLLIPVADGDLVLGTWQGVYFAEFDGPRQRRRIYVTPLQGA